MLADKIRMLRKEMELTQAELAKEIGINRSSVASWESGLRTPPVDMIAKMCGVFHVSADYLCTNIKERSFIKTLITEEIDITKLNARGIDALTEYYKFLLKQDKYTKYDV